MEDSTTRHPYYPLEAPLEHYAVNETPPAMLLIAFGSIIVLVVLAAVMSVKSTYPPLTRSDQLTVAWFALCGFLHCVFEGYFVFNHKSLAGLQTLFSQLWKEYALSDSRYLTSDPFMLCVESITVFIWGPLSCAIVVAIAKRSPLRHPLQLIMSVGHLYGVALYYLTSLIESYYHADGGFSHSRPEFLYFWVYYVGFNGPWVVVPALLLYQSVMHIKRGLENLDETGSIRIVSCDVTMPAPKSSQLKKDE